jgi:NDP-4-keto-2,6-dideoxyhexose 3-C-methyltransferase
MSEKFSYLKECIVCGNNKLKKVISFKKHFVSGKFIPKNQKVINEVKTPLTLLLCKDRSCGHLQLKEIVNSKILFNQTFYRSSMNSTMRTQLKDVVSKTVQLAKPIKNDLIIDIGSNDSTLLSFYRKKFNLIGFEPSNKIIRVKTKNKIKVIENFFNLPDIKKITKKKAKIITSCAMFYAVSNPLDFIKNISLLLDLDGVWTLQITQKFY